MSGWFWQQGYDDAIAGRRFIMPDETWQRWQRDDYAAGYEAGCEELAVEDDDDDGPH